MRPLRAWLLQLVGLLTTARSDRELAEELESHVQLHVDDNIRAGMTYAEARRDALMKLGGVEQTKEIYRDRRGISMLDTLVQDLRYAVRTLRQARWFTGAALATLTLGIGANAAMFSVVNAVLLKPLPYPDADRIVMLINSSPEGSLPVGLSTEFDEWRHQTTALDDISAYRVADMSVSDGPDPELIMGLQVSAEFFRLFGATLAKGRSFTATEQRPNGDHAAILRYGFWQRRFGGNPDVVGRTIPLDGVPVRIVGILAPGFAFETLPYVPQRPLPDVLLPLQLDPNSSAPVRYLIGAARLKPGVALTAARSQARLAGEEFRRKFPIDMEPSEAFDLERLRDRVLGDVRPSLFVLAAAVGFILLIACANVANLWLVRASVRKREIAIRAAIGASRRRLIRQLLTESVVLSSAGGLLGLMLGVIGIRALLAMSSGDIPWIGNAGTDVTMDWHVLAFTVIVAVLTGVLCGLFPAVEGSRAELGASLTEAGARTGLGVRQRKARSLLVMAEMALTLVLVIGAALFIRTFAALQGVDPGFDAHSVLNVPMAVTGPRFQKTPAVAQIVHDGERRLRGVPGVVSGAAACCMPMLGSYQLSFTIVGRALNGPAHGLGAWVNISPGYFDVFKMPLIRGRAFTDRDNDASAGVVIINQVMARRFWPNGDPLTDRLLIGKGFAPAAEPDRQIVGIVGDVRNGGLDGEPVPMMYVPMAQVPDALTALHSRVPMLWFVRTATEPFAFSAAIQTALHEASGGAPIAKTFIRPGDELVVGTTAPAAFRMALMTIFAGTALLLAAIGVYGVMAYSVQQRTPEIGIRIALGAPSTQVRNMVLVQGMRMALIGVAIGLASAFGLARVIRNLLFGVTARDPAVFIMVPIALGIVAFVAIWVPARRATRVDPMAALRHE